VARKLLPPLGVTSKVLRSGVIGTLLSRYLGQLLGWLARKPAKAPGVLATLGTSRALFRTSGRAQTEDQRYSA